MIKKQVNLNEKQTQMWNDIKDLEVQYYALKEHTVGSVSEPINIDPDSLYLSLKGPAALVSIEEALSKMTVKSWSGKILPKYAIEQRDQYAFVEENPEVKPPMKKI